MYLSKIAACEGSSVDFFTEFDWAEEQVIMKRRKPDKANDLIKVGFIKRKISLFGNANNDVQCLCIVRTDHQINDHARNCNVKPNRPGYSHEFFVLVKLTDQGPVCCKKNQWQNNSG
jgi:hypothetical protein